MLWLRGDLRVVDHHGWPLLADGDAAVFALDDRLERLLTAPRRRWLAGALAEVDAWAGGRLSLLRVRHGHELAERLLRAGATEVITHDAVAPRIRERIGVTAAHLAAHGVTLRIVDSPYAVAPGTMTHAHGGPWKVFGAFYRAWWPRVAQLTPVAPAALVALTMLERDFGPDDLAPPEQRYPAATDAARRLGRFLAERLSSYASERDRPAVPATSELSGALHVGAIHPRTILAALREHDHDAHNVDRFRRELAWREFYAHALWAEPSLVDREVDASLRSIAWEQGATADERFEAWRQGRTGYPIVDAGMRELATTGRLHNRVRMIVASFLVKDLLVDWRKGAEWFERCLEDADLASNRGNWQWVAGTGLDAAPYFRVFNPTLQGKRFDPDGSYVRRHVPELADAPHDVIHEPWRWPGRIASGYPPPIVDHAEARREALVRYEAARAEAPSSPRERPAT